MRILICFLLFCLVGTLVCEYSEKKHEKEKGRRVKRFAITLLLGTALTTGASLIGTTVTGLKSSSYRVSVSGSVENYSKWTLKLQTCEIKSGYMNTPLRTIVPGYREGFASHKTSNTATGSYVRCTFDPLNGDLIHIMYSAPYSFDFHANWLGFAICPKSSSECRSITADKMYYEKTSYAKLKKFARSISQLRTCGTHFCMTGTMGTSHKPELDIRVYPTDYERLSTAVKKSSAKNRWSKGDYETFVNSM
ncbi:tereporin-Ca1-like [Hydractinia symbiolongicarpus]|uniref:tereporin-Ca1-like n=1 Tax=Hydractinia symbiolongicarpus TaxID=13093 RepID=UPI00254C6C3D|nr:tereporin-Ca1-like [Hydractinia symbiolongicarpus]